MAAASPGTDARKYWRTTRCKLAAALLLLVMCIIYISIPVTDLNDLEPTDSDSDYKRDTSFEQAVRKILLNGVCNRTSQQASTRSWDRFFVIPDEQIMFCLVRKVGSNYFKSLLARLAHRCNSTSVSFGCKVRTLDSFSEYERDNMLDSFTKIMFVRDPLERLWSVYNNHLASFNPRWAVEFGVDIIKAVRYNGSPKDDVCGNDVTFKEFLEYIAWTAKELNYFNPHWQPYHSICDPCHVEYDFVGKLETFDKDITNLEQLYPAQIPKDLTRNASTRAGKVSAITRMPFLENNKSPYLQKLPKRCSSIRLYLEARIRALHNLGIDIASPDVLLPSGRVNHDELIVIIRANLAREVTKLDMKQVRLRRNSRLRAAFCGLNGKLREKIIKLYSTDSALFGYSFPYCGH